MPENSEKNVRPKLDEELFRELHGQGLTDSAIAEALGVSRLAVLRCRRKLGLEANRKVGERGPGKPRDEKAYYDEVRRVMANPEVARAMFEAARLYRRDPNAGPEAQRIMKSLMALIIDPPPVPKFAPGPAGSVDRMDPGRAETVVQMEKAVAGSGRAGVPGPAIFKLAEVIKTASAEVVRALALQAVAEAFWVGVHRTVASVLGGLRAGVEAAAAMWAELKEAVRSWAPAKGAESPVLEFWVDVRGRLRVAERCLRFLRPRGSGGGGGLFGRTGARGKKGGIRRSLDEAVAATALTRV